MSLRKANTAVSILTYQSSGQLLKLVTRCGMGKIRGRKLKHPAPLNWRTPLDQWLPLLKGCAQRSCRLTTTGIAVGHHTTVGGFPGRVRAGEEGWTLQGVLVVQVL
jgi:hypothetical protein